MRGSRLALLLVLSLLPILGCGGGGGDGGGDPADARRFEGSYGFVLIEWIQAEDFARSTVGRLTPDGAGVVTLEQVRAVQAGTARPSVLSPMTYAEDGVGRVVLTDRTGRRFDADVGPGGSMLVATTRQAATQPALLLLVRRTSDFARTDFEGEWMELAWGHATLPSGGGTENGDYALAWLQSVDEDEDMTMEGGYLQEIEETIALGSATGAALYILPEAGGRVSWHRQFDNLQTHEGNFSSDRNLMLLGGEYAGTETSATLLVRRSQPIRAGGLAGVYRLGGIGSSLFGHHVRWGTATFDGAGAGSSVFDHNAEGALFPGGSVDFDYTVDAESRITVHWGDSRVPLRGIVGAGGDYVILAGAFDNGEPAQLSILVR